MSPADPAFGFTLGTTWGLVQDLSAGGLLGGSFAFILTAYLQGVHRAVLPAIFGAIAGAALWWIGDSTSDRVNISVGIGSEAAGMLWCVIVPPCIAASVVIAMGPTKQRWIRAGVASLIAVPVAYFGRELGDMISAVAFISHSSDMFAMALTPPPPPSDGGLSLMQAAIPVWTITHACTGLALGIAFALAEQIISTGCLYMAVGKEGRVWALTKTINRIGTQEGVEVRLPPSPGIAPVHATIIRKSGSMLFQPVNESPAGLNGYAVESAWLSDGDVLGIGGVDLVFYGRSRPPANSSPVFASAVAAQPIVRKDFRLIDSFGNVHSLAQGRSTIGRDKDNAICLSWDSTVSGMHAAVDLQGEKVVIRDMASQTGVQVAGVTVREQMLRPGDVITVGNTKLTFRD